jgi:replicative DNA helicase
MKHHLPRSSRNNDSKHRNGSIENVRLKFIGHLGKFDNLEDHSGNYDLPSSMNQDDNPFQTKVYPRHMKHLE